MEATAGIAATQNCDEDVKLGAKSFTSDAVSSAGYVADAKLVFNVFSIID